MNWARIDLFRVVLHHLPPVFAGSFGALIVFPYPQVTGGVLQHLYVVAFQKVRDGEGAVDRGDGMGLVVDPHSIGRGLLQDRKGRGRTEVAAQAALF